MGEGLAAIDAAIIVALLILVTWMGHRLSGGIDSRRGFFQADGKLPWWAVSASIIATLVSSVTFVSVPAAVFREGGDLTYFQVIVGLALGKVAIALLLARAYYLSTGLRTAYEYIGARTDPRVGEFSMVVGLALNMINGALKLLTASLVLDVITGWGLPGCAAVVIAVSVLWSAMAGIKTVIWTDFLLFLLFAAGALFALVYTSSKLPQSLYETWIWLDSQAKTVLFDFSTDLEKRYTLWAAIIGSIGLSIALGATQATWQRVRSCRSAADACRAYNYSALFYVMHLAVLGVGLALVAFYAAQPLPEAVVAQLQDQPDRIFPYFIVTELPVGVSGLFIAAIFAAAISTIDSVLTETADLSLRHIYERVNQQASERRYILVSRLMLGFWGIAFWALAVFFSQFSAEGLLDLTFKLPNYLYGAIFGTIILARFGIGRFPTFIAGFAVAAVVVGWLSSAGVAFFWWCPISGASMIATVWLLDRRAPELSGVVRDA